MKSSLLFSAAVVLALSIPAGSATSAPTAAAPQQFAQCAAAKYEGAELLATQPGSPEEADVLSEYASRGCTVPTNDTGIVRGLVAEQLFKSDFGSIGARPRRETIEVFTVDASELETLDDNAKKRIDAVAFGTCVAASDPGGSSALLKTTAGAADEKSAMTQMVPKFAPCLNEGERFDFSRAQLRGALAEGAYRLALAESSSKDVVVTGTRDKSKSVQCKQMVIPGSHMRRSVCMTEAAWEVRERDQEYAVKDTQRQAREYIERKTACISRSLFGEGGAGAPCLMN